jgi:ribosomal protein S18 acetylase RimI-like enzyme
MVKSSAFPARASDFHLLQAMNEPCCSSAITIRVAVCADADQIGRIYMESAKQHAILDSERYWMPSPEAIAERYREKLQHYSGTGLDSVTLVALLGGEIVAFIDAGLDQSPDPMHRQMLYCHIAEIAVSIRYRNRGIGAQLLACR